MSQKSSYNDGQKTQKIQNVGSNWDKNLRKYNIWGEIPKKKTQQYDTKEPLKKSKFNPKSANVSKSPYNDGQKSKIF